MLVIAADMLPRRWFSVGYALQEIERMSGAAVRTAIWDIMSGAVHGENFLEQASSEAGVLLVCPLPWQQTRENRE